MTARSSRTRSKNEPPRRHRKDFGDTIHNSRWCAERYVWCPRISRISAAPGLSRTDRSRIACRASMRALDLSLIPHRWRGPALHATLIARPNKFLAICRIGRLVIEAHVPDRGRCLDLLVPGQPLVLVEDAPQTGMPPRRTRYTVLLARACTSPSPWVCLDPA